MPSVPGLSLVGFIEDEREAEGYLEHRCIVPGVSNRQGRIRFWKQARNKLGPPIDDAGHPNIRPFPDGHESLKQKISEHPRFKSEVLEHVKSFSFQEIEIDRLLAFQFDVDTSMPSSSEDAISRCLPEVIPEAPPSLPEVVPAKEVPKGLDGMFRIVSPELNLKAFGWTEASLNDVPALNLKMAGPVYGRSIPWVQVTSWGGRYFLSNGHHRAFQLRKQDITHIPCLLLEVTRLERVGIREGQTLSDDLFFTKNKPAFAHFSQGRAAEVRLRLMDRVIEVGWVNRHRHRPS